MKTKKKPKVIYVKSDKVLHGRLEKAAVAIDRPMSQIVREAVAEKLDMLEKSQAQPATA